MTETPSGTPLTVPRPFMRRLAARIARPGLLSNVLSLYAVQGLNYLVPLLLLPYLLRVLSPEGYGSIMLAQSLLGYGIIFTEFGFNLTSARDISVARADPIKVAKVYWTTMTAKALLALVSVIVIGVVVMVTPSFRSHWPVFAASSLLVVGNLTFPQWYFQGTERLREVALVQAVSKCVVAASAVLLVHGPSDTCIAALIMGGPQVAGAIAAAAMGISLAPALRYRPTRKDVTDAMRRSSHMFASIVSTTLYLQTNVLALGLICGEREVALYSVGSRLVAAMQSFSIPITQAVFPRASLLFAEHPEEAWALLRRVSLFVLPTLALAGLLLGILAPTVVHLIGGPTYAEAASVVRIMAVVPLLVALATGLSQTIMVNTGLTKPLFRIYVIVGCLNLALMPILVFRFASQGAAAALVVAEALGPILMVTTIWRRRSALTNHEP